MAEYEVVREGQCWVRQVLVRAHLGAHCINVIIPSHFCKLQ